MEFQVTCIKDSFTSFTSELLKIFGLMGQQSFEGETSKDKQICEDILSLINMF